MHAYIYQFMITFKGNIVQIYRNALVFAIGFLPMNLLLNIIPALVTAIVFIYLNRECEKFSFLLLQCCAFGSSKVYANTP